MSSSHKSRQFGNMGARRCAVALFTAGLIFAGPLLAPDFAALPLTTPALAQPAESKPYDDKLTRLAEIMGAVHFLRELCGSSDGQIWRERMRELLDGEGSTALRRAKLTRSFNSGYRSYSRTYQTCTPTAQTAIGRFLTEGVQLADSLVKSVP